MKKKLLIIPIVSILILSIGLSYAYFTGMISGVGKKFSISAKELRIVFTDTSEIVSSEIVPGWSETKTFSIKNESNGVFNYNIIFENLVNTFVTTGFLQYKITSSNGYNMEEYLDIPKSNTPKNYVLAYDIDIEAGEIQEYTIEFIYHDSETVDQSDDMGKEFGGNLAISEGTVNPNIKYTVTMDSEHGTVTPTTNETIKKGNLEFTVTPDTGYDIESMSVNCNPVANTVILDNKIRVNDIRQNHACTVSFDKITYTVDIIVNNGTSTAANKIIEHGQSGMAVITPDPGYTLTGSTIEGEGCTLNETTGELIISNVTSNGVCEVTLDRDTYTVTLTGEEINTSNSPQTAEYEGSAILNYTLKEGYYMGESSINCDNNATPVVNGNTITVSNVTANTTCTITPILSSYNVTLKVNGGTVNGKAEDTISVQHGSSGAFTIAASTESGYKLELDGTISCEGASGSLSGGTVTISNVTKAQTCTVNLKRQTFAVSISVSPTAGGSVSPASTTVEYGKDLEVTITPADGYKYSENSCGGTVTNNILTIPKIKKAITCQVSFTRVYTWTINAERSTEPTQSYTVSEGEDGRVSLNSAVNLLGSTVTGQGCSIGWNYIWLGVKVENVRSDVTCTVNTPAKSSCSVPPIDNTCEYAVVVNGSATSSSAHCQTWCGDWARCGTGYRSQIKTDESGYSSCYCYICDSNPIWSSPPQE